MTKASAVIDVIALESISAFFVRRIYAAESLILTKYRKREERSKQSHGIRLYYI